MQDCVVQVLLPYPPPTHTHTYTYSDHPHSHHTHSASPYVVPGTSSRRKTDPRDGVVAQPAAPQARRRQQGDTSCGSEDAPLPLAHKPNHKSPLTAPTHPTLPWPEGRPLPTLGDPGGQPLPAPPPPRSTPRPHPRPPSRPHGPRWRAQRPTPLRATLGPCHHHHHRPRPRPRRCLPSPPLSPGPFGTRGPRPTRQPGAPRCGCPGSPRAPRWQSAWRGTPQTPRARG